MGDTKKSLYIVSLTVVSILMVSTFISAGFLEDIKAGITGSATATVGLNVTIGVIQITAVDNDTLDLNTGGLTAGPSNTTIYMNFTAYHGGGFFQISNTTGVVNLTFKGEQLRDNTTCEVDSTWGTNYKNFSCRINLWFFDRSGTWNITAYVEDTSGNGASNLTQRFGVPETTGFTISAPAFLSWPGLSPGDINKTASDDPIILNNTGNKDVLFGGIDINSTDLIGETDPTQALYAGNFTMSNTSSGTAECDIGRITGSQMNVTGSSYTNISGANMSRGNFTSMTNTSGQEELYFCITLAGSELSDQAYSTNGSIGKWTVRIT